jgi:hypothetical protein
MRKQVFTLMFISIQWLFATEPNWTVNPSDYSNSMVVVGVLSLDGVESVDANDKIAAFINGEVRGVAQLQYESSVDRYVAFMLIYSNEASGTINFKVYDADMDLELDLSNSLNFNINGSYGNLGFPFRFSDVPLSNNAMLLEFTIPNQVNSTNVDGTEVSVEMISGTDLTDLIAAFSVSDGAVVYVGSAPQVSGSTSNDFTSPVTYTIVSESGLVTNEYTVTATVESSEELSDEAELLSYFFEEQVGAAQISAGSVIIEVAEGTDISSLISTYSVSSGAAVYINDVAQTSGVTSNDFTSPVTYTIVSESGLVTNEYTVTATVESSEELSDEAELLSYFFEEQVGAAQISAGSVIIEVAEGTDISSLISTYSVSSGAAVYINDLAQTSGVTRNDFTSPVTYAIVSESGLVTNEYTITVTVESSVELSDEAELRSFSFEEQVSAAQISSGTVGIEVIESANLNSLVASFSVSEAAIVYIQEIAQESGVTSNDFSQSVVYRVVSESGNVSNSYVVSVGQSTLEYSLSLSSLSVDENIGANSIVGVIQSNLQNPQFEFADGEGDEDNGLFEIVNGELVLNESPNFESQSNYSIRITGFDGSNSVESSFQIHVEDVNEAPSDMILSNTEIAENMTSGVILGTFSVSDPDANQTHSLSLVDGVSANEFFVLEDNLLKAAVGFDFENNSNYSIEIQVSDQDGLSLTKSFEIEVRDVNESPIVTTEIPDVVVSDEDVSISLDDYYADPDSGDDLTYSLTALGQSSLPSGISFDVSTGSVVISRLLNASYFLEVIASDRNGLSVDQRFQVGRAFALETDLSTVAIQVFPNPSSDFVHVSGLDQNQWVMISDVSGKSIIETRDASRIDVRGLTTGIYFIHVEGDNAAIRFRKQ